MSESTTQADHASLRDQSYWCFISYTHADNREQGRQWATWLHQTLETYEVPDDLVGTLNERGEKIPARIFPVFRDEEELSTGNLAERIYETLDRTKVLIVICSPLVIESEYVFEEIRYFKQYRDAEAIHAAVIEGNPGSQAKGDGKCFPDSLRYDLDADGNIDRNRMCEPLAANFRLDDESQGWTTPEAHRQALVEKQNLADDEIDLLVARHRERLENSKLQLIAGVLGVPLGDLKRRDQRYQLELARKKARTLRRWLVAVSALAALVVTFAAASYWQYSLKQAADRVSDANQAINVARMTHDQNPLGALHVVFQSLDVLKADAPQAVDETYENVSGIVRSGRWARIGENVQGIYPTGDGKLLIVDHAEADGEIIRVSDLKRVELMPEIRHVSDFWGPNSSWKSFDTTDGSELRDMRSGQKLSEDGEFPPTVDFATFVKPATDHQWKPLTPYNHPQAYSSAWLDYCYLNSIDDEAEWAAVDTVTYILNYRSGKREYSESELYEFKPNASRDLPCFVARDDSGWFLRNPQIRVVLGDTFDVESYEFSPCGQFLLVESEDIFTLYACETGKVTCTRACSEPMSGQYCFSSDGNQLLFLRNSLLEAVECATGDVEGKLRIQANASTTSIVAVPVTPSAWEFTNDGETEIVVAVGDELLRGLSSIDPSCRYAATRNENQSVLIDLSTGSRTPIDCTRIAFCNHPESGFFVTIRQFADERNESSVSLHKFSSPGQASTTYEMRPPLYGEVQVDFKMFGSYMLVTEYERIDPEDPPFKRLYSYRTHIVDSITGKELDSVDFLVESVEGIMGGWGTILNGFDRSWPDEERHDRYAIIRNDTKKVIWSSTSRDEVIAQVHFRDSEGSFFVVGYQDVPGNIHCASNGEIVAELPDVVTKVDFVGVSSSLILINYRGDKAAFYANSGVCELPDQPREACLLPEEKGHIAIAIWYENGNCELWSLEGEKPMLLGQLGLIVSEVWFIPNTRNAFVLHEDGRAYLLNMDWLKHIHHDQPSTKQLIEEIRNDGQGPASVPWWTRHPSLGVTHEEDGKQR